MFLYTLAVASCVIVLAYILSLIPVFSQPPVLGGKYLLLSCAAGAIWGARIWTVSIWPEAGRLALLGAVLTLAATYDANRRIIPNRLVTVGLAAALLWSLSFERAWFDDLLTSGFVMLLFMVFVGLIGRGALGAGDVKLITLLAAYTGLEASLVLSAGGFLLLSIPGIYQSIRGKGLRYRLPYAPFLWLAALVLLGSPYLKGLGR